MQRISLSCLMPVWNEIFVHNLGFGISSMVIIIAKIQRFKLDLGSALFCLEYKVIDLLHEATNSPIHSVSHWCHLNGKSRLLPFRRLYLLFLCSQRICQQLICDEESVSFSNLFEQLHRPPQVCDSLSSSSELRQFHAGFGFFIWQLQPPRFLE